MSSIVKLSNGILVLNDKYTLSPRVQFIKHPTLDGVLVINDPVVGVWYLHYTEFTSPSVNSLDQLFTILAGYLNYSVTGTEITQLGADISVNSGKQLKTTLYDSLGNLIDNYKLETLGSNISVNNGKQLKNTLYDSLGNLIEDNITSTLKIIDYEHHEIHDGSHFFISDFATGLANNDDIDFVITTPNTLKWAHMTFAFESTAGAKLDAYEGSSAVVGGSAVTSVNSNRNSATASVLTITKDPTSITTGPRLFGSLAGANRIAGSTERRHEIILKQNTIYLFRFTSLAVSNSINYRAAWYEHTNKS